jgi:Flp pilus assembly protein TadG
MSFKAFLRNRDGGVAPMLALAAIPLVGFVGAAVDYSRASAVRTAMQIAADATSLMLAKDIQANGSAHVVDNAPTFFAANFNQSQANNLQVTATYNQTATASSVVVTASASVNTKFVSSMGLPAINMSVNSTTEWGNSRLRVALVLDNTGSMASSGKMTALKTATHNLLDQLKKAAKNPGDVYVSMIPFVKDVNVGPSNYTASWIDWTDWDKNNGTCTISGKTNQTSCQSAGKCSKSGYSSQSTCQSAGGTWTWGTWTPKNHNTWNGCVMDRDQNFDTTNTPPTTGGTLFPAEQYSACPVPLMGLTYDWAALNALVDAMQPNGSTNQAIGLQWGFQSLTSPPLTVPPMDPNYKYQQVIVLLTDGLNTQDRWYGNGSTTSTQVDARQAILCNNIKAAGITLYTVQVNTGGDPTSTLLQSCASDPTKFFLLTSSEQIVTTFGQIGTTLVKLHLSK